MLRPHMKAAEYRCRALEASVLAGASPLAQVRERYESAAARWTMLAQLSERQGSRPKADRAGAVIPAIGA